MGTAGAGSERRPGRGTPTPKPVSHRHVTVRGTGTVPAGPARSRPEHGTAGGTGAARGLGGARVGEGPVGAGARAPIRTPKSRRWAGGCRKGKGLLGGSEASPVGIRAPGWEPFCEGKSVCRDDAQTASALLCPPRCPPTQRQPGLPARSGQQRRPRCPAAAASACPSARRGRHYCGHYLLLSPPPASSWGAGRGERAREGGTARGASPSPSQPPCHRRVAAPIARHRPSPPPARAGFGGPTAIPPAMPGRAQHHPA